MAWGCLKRGGEKSRGSLGDYVKRHKIPGAQGGLGSERRKGHPEP